MSLGRGLSALIPNKKETSISSARAPLGEGQIWFIPCSAIHPNPHQPRKEFAHQQMEELISSIKEHGVLQPLIVTERSDGEYDLVAGERRLRASTIAGLPTVPCLVRHLKDEEKLAIALVENIQRKELNPIEESFAYSRLLEEFGLTHEEIAKKVGKSRPYISNMLRLLALPDEIQRALIDGALPYTKARALLALEDKSAQVKMFRKIVSGKMPTGEVEREARGARISSKGLRRDPLIESYERELREVLGTKVRITGKGGKGTVTIEYYAPEELQGLVGRIAKE